MGGVVWNETEGQVQDRLRARVARLEGELAEAQKELESKDEELRLAREDFSPEAWEDLLQRLEKSEAAIRAKDAALGSLLEDGRLSATTHDNIRAALSPDEAQARQKEDSDEQAQ